MHCRMRLPAGDPIYHVLNRRVGWLTGSGVLHGEGKRWRRLSDGFNYEKPIKSCRHEQAWFGGGVPEEILFWPQNPCPAESDAG